MSGWKGGIFPGEVVVQATFSDYRGGGLIKREGSNKRVRGGRETEIFAILKKKGQQESADYAGDRGKGVPGKKLTRRREPMMESNHRRWKQDSYLHNLEEGLAHL